MRRARVEADENANAIARRLVTWMLLRMEYPSLHGAVLIGLLVGYEMARRERAIE
jgi:hypothetical protein